MNHIARVVTIRSVWPSALSTPALLCLCVPRPRSKRDETIGIHCLTHLTELVNEKEWMTDTVKGS